MIDGNLPQWLNDIRIWLDTVEIAGLTGNEFLFILWKAIQYALGGLAAFLLYYLYDSWFLYRRWVQDSMVFSRNSFRGNLLELRTLYIVNPLVAFSNRAVRWSLYRAARRCTPTQPIVRLTGQASDELVQRRLVNLLSSHFGPDLHASEEEETYVFFLTFERGPLVQAIQFRVLMIREQDLLDLTPEKAAALEFEKPWHKQRADTLLAMKAEYEKRVEDPEALLTLKLPKH